CLPEQQVDRVERQIVAEAWGGVDRDKSALVAALEDVVGRQVAVQKGCRRDGLHKASRKLPSSFVQLRRDDLDEARTTFVRPRPRVEEVFDAIREWREGTAGDTGCTE